MTGVSKTWCFTLNNYTDEEFLKLINLPREMITYAVIGREHLEEGTPHLQGFITFREAHRMASLKSISSRIHWEISRSVEASKKYCIKEGNYVIVDFRRGKTGPLLEKSVTSGLPETINRDSQSSDRVIDDALLKLRPKFMSLKKLYSI